MSNSDLRNSPIEENGRFLTTFLGTLERVLLHLRDLSNSSMVVHKYSFNTLTVITENVMCIVPDTV